jgi:hypothetical protein
MHKCHKWSLGDIKKLYKNGQPGNHLSVVGLTVHGFDGTLQGHPNFIGQNNSTEEETAKLAKRPLPWKPCNSGWCKNSAKWLSTSVINARHHPGFSDGGIILKPSANTVLCSHFRDFGSLEKGCKTAISSPFNIDSKPYPTDSLKEMLERSMTYKQAYNEVLVDGAVYTSNLPHSIAAFYYGLLKSEQDEREQIWSRVHASQMYVSFLDHYNLTESKVPLIQFELDKPYLMTDMASHARGYLKAHPYGYALKKWREEHADLAEHPNRIYAELRKRADMRREKPEPKATRDSHHPLAKAKAKTKAEAVNPGANSVPSLQKASMADLVKMARTGKKP